MSNAKQAFEAASKGYWVFPVREKDATPYTSNGLNDASNDPHLVDDWFTERFPNALVAIHTGKSGVVVLDLDVKRDDSGKIVKDGFESLAESGREYPFTHTNTSRGGEGEHHWFLAPENARLGPDSNILGMQGVDRRGGGSYVALPAGVSVPAKDELEPAPEWLTYESKARQHVFSGSVAEWFEALEPGEPDGRVESALKDLEAQFERNGDDLSHNEIVNLQHRAVRLGAEGATGVKVLLDRIEEMALTRTGEHSRDPEEWAAEYNEALESGIAKHGDAIEIRSYLIPYSLEIVPSEVSTSLVAGDPGDRHTFTSLLRELVKHTDDKTALSILWGAPRTKDLARDWGLEFVWSRVQEAREEPSPDQENPEYTEKRADEKRIRGGVLDDEERQIVRDSPSFPEAYIRASQSKGFTNTVYAEGAAWTALSMAFGMKAYVPTAKDIPVNLWFLVLGESSTGKSTEDSVLRAVLDITHRGHEQSYNLGATSSPQAVHEALLVRDGLPSMVHHDEASDFFREINTQEWMKSVTDLHAKYYEGYVPPEQKIRLKELRGKDAKTSFDVFMLATPDRLLSQLDLSMYETGYLARFNFIWDQREKDNTAKYKIRVAEREHSGPTPEVRALGRELTLARMAIDEPVMMSVSPEVNDRLNEAYEKFDSIAQGHRRYEKFQASVTRLGTETLFKCAFLIALWEGRSEVFMEDALIAIYWAEKWFGTNLEVAGEISESPYSRDVEEMVEWVRDEGGSVSHAAFLNAFKGKILKSSRELKDRIDFAVESGRLLRKNGDGGGTLYVLNE